tara:strand:- start:31877 stop:32065 length:189 start_codon:yes stop_codon:yes gene_type:complete
MNKDFCEKTIECIESLGNKVDLLEEASKLMSEMIQELNKKINILDEQLKRVSKSNKVDYKED